MEKNFIILCDSAEVEPSTKKLNIKGVFDTIFVDGVPAVYAKEFSVITNFEVNPGAHTGSYRIIDDTKGTVVVDHPIFNFSVSELSNRHQFIHRLINLNLNSIGKYTVKIFIDNQEVGSTYFIVKQVAASPSYYSQISNA